jgi:large repetitive protein
LICVAGREETHRTLTASPHTIIGLSDGTHTIYLKAVDKEGKRDPSPAQWKFTVIGDNDSYPDTWINWFRTEGGQNIPHRGKIVATKVIVDFQGTVAGPGSHIDLKIDSGSYVPVASPHTITGLSDGPHTIYLKAVNQAGKADPTPAKWRFTVINDDD